MKDFKTIIAGLFFIFLFTIVNLRGQESDLFYKNSLSYSYVASRKGSLAELKYERFLNLKSASPKIKNLQKY